MSRTPEWASVSLTIPGQSICGDKHLITDVSEGTLVAVVDGIGHGEKAAAAADRALQIVEECKSQSLPEIVRRCDEALRGTRGVAMALAEFNADDCTVTWLGIGNVAGRVHRRAHSSEFTHETLLQRPGMVGDQRLPRMQTASLHINSGDILVLATDGVDPNFVESIDANANVETIAEAVLAAHCDQSDDALTFVIRYLD